VEISFILVEPAVPENIGSAARAINTMGYSDLRLVNPANHLAEQALWLGHGSHHILKNAVVFTQFDAAVADLDFIIGTTAKNRSVKKDYYSPEEARELILNKKTILQKIGIVFGREESGLTNRELAACDLASSIELANPYPSINLAQSVMLYAYVFSSFDKKFGGYQKNTTPNTNLFKELKVSSNEILNGLDIPKGSNLHDRMTERIAAVSDDDAHLFMSFVKKFKQKFE
jgi:tRNA/rRNA methyltransferase